MMARNGLLHLPCFSSPMLLRMAKFSTTSATRKSYELVVVGGGAGGCATAAKFSSRLGQGKVAVIEPSDIHYYQPMWTLVGGGIKKLQESGRPMSQVLPKKADWLKQKVIEFKPEQNKVVIEDGTEVNYKYLVVAVGLQLNFDQIKGLPEAFETPGVCSNYSPLYVEKTFAVLKNFEEGNALFNLPSTPVKCAGAPQKMMYITEEYLRNNGRRAKANIVFNTSGSALFGVKKYADVLWKVVEKRGITVNMNHNLVEIKTDTKEAVFHLTDGSDKHVTMPYEMIHVVPPMSAPDVLRNTKILVDQNGYLNLHKDTLQHLTFPNIFGIGDCTNLPTSKTAAAIAGQIGVLRKNLSSVMAGKEAQSVYDGYTSCPLVTGYSTCILAEFDYGGNPLETFPVNQAKERRTMFHMKKDFMPFLYWHGLLNGLWEGPKIMRKALHFGFGK